MKKFSLVALIAIGSVLYAGPLVKKNKVVDISFDGYCDGLHLEINHATGDVLGNATGCFDDLLAGTSGSNPKKGLGVVAVRQSGEMCYIYHVDDVPQNWYVTSCDGTFINSGTYSVGVPEMEAEAKDAAVNSALIEQ